jgi:putative salt-induced outer membrane protein
MAVALGVSLAGAISVQAQAPAPAPAPAPAEPKWESSAGLGFSLTRGNSKNLLFTANVASQKKWDNNEVRLGANGAYGESDSIKNTEQVLGFAQYNRLFTERAYGYLRLDALHDSVADIEYRFNFSPGVGYYFIKNQTTSLSGEVGPGFIHEKLGGDDRSYMTLRVAERFEHKFNERVRMWQSLEWLPQVDNFNNYILNSEIGVAASLTDNLSLKVFAQDVYDNEPAPNRKKNDLRLVTGIDYKF